MYQWSVKCTILPKISVTESGWKVSLSNFCLQLPHVKNKQCSLRQRGTTVHALCLLAESQISLPKTWRHFGIFSWRYWSIPERPDAVCNDLRAKRYNFAKQQIRNKSTEKEACKWKNSNRPSVCNNASTENKNN